MTFKAHVRNGRIVLDEPTGLPDGAEVELVPVDVWDDLSADDRHQIEQALVASEEDLAAGRFVPADEFLARLRQA